MRVCHWLCQCFVNLVKAPHRLLMCHSLFLSTARWGVNPPKALAEPVALNLMHHVYRPFDAPRLPFLLVGDFYMERVQSAVNDGRQ